MPTISTSFPDSVFIWSDDLEGTAAHDDGSGTWTSGAVHVLLGHEGQDLVVRLAAPRSGVNRVALRWNRGVSEDALVLGDAWERSYGDLHWEHIRPERILPWYWLATSASGAQAAGVHVRAGAFCSWTVNVDGVTLWLDVRSGSRPVRLGERVLEVAMVTTLEDAAPRSAMDFHRELCRALCRDPIPAADPLVGSNNWYYAYGRGFDDDAVVRDAELISALSGDHAVRPFTVIDAGWSEGTTAPGGPWTTGSGSFTDMSGVATRIRGEGVRPGLWFRPLLSRVPSAVTHEHQLDGGWPMDPSLDQTLEIVAADLARFRDWGYDLVKHDFSSYDVLGRFLSDRTAELTSAPWRFADESRTTAEILVAFYTRIKDASDGVTIIGCNVVGHLAAGLVEAQRTGDDTSGRHWERTRRMGVNTLAFRLAQHDSFFTVDPDCVPSTPQTPWETNRQFLDLIAQSGAALFVSVDPTTRTPEIDADLTRAIRTALDGGAEGGVDPLDWQTTSAPRRWRVGAQVREYSWSIPWGTDLGMAGI